MNFVTTFCFQAKFPAGTSVKRRIGAKSYRIALLLISVAKSMQDFIDFLSY